MLRCSACSTEIPEQSRFCLQCGKPAHAVHPDAVNPDNVETVATGVAAALGTRASPTPTPNGYERFAPGVLLAGRYRIVSPLGQGGMGEVYRADDLILGQPVALKFLPLAAKDNVNLLTRFYEEVRIARQISHKNVCRVYDIGEVDGQPYLSMEYIDGEDLGSLLRRIGRLPADKALEFARKLCAGVAAAHAQGILHRDIKPANIMIDARGELRITDFGLAAVAEQLLGGEVRNGTPAYMAPEQLRGEQVSVRSDLYAIGLVLYEMFTGKLPFQANTLAEMTRLRQESRVTTPSTLIGDLDKNVERAILRCLEADPAMRPPSALALAAMLPGGDPLAAALAEGETPSPEAVAAAGSTEALSPKIAIPALAGILLGITLFCLVSPRLYLINLVPLDNPPEVLSAKAREIAQGFGYTERAGDQASGFYVEPPNVEYMRAKGHNMTEWARIFSEIPSGLGYWYRQSPGPLVPERSRSYGMTGVTDPPATVPGMLSIALEIDGRLRRFSAIPPDRQPPATQTTTPDWAPFFAAAQLDMRAFQPVAPEWTPPMATDARAAWTGPYAGRPDLPVRVEAAYFHGQPVFFQIFWPWTRSTRLTPLVLTTAQAFSNAAYFIGGALVLIAAIWIARYNWKAGRGDPRGATRIGLYCAAMSLIGWLLRAHHVATQAEQGLIGDALANAAFIFLEYWLIYLALEPWVRRYWPQALITWSRVLSGRWRDPLVGRDLLFGILFGMAYLLLLALFAYALMRSGSADFGQFNLGQLNGFRAFSSMTANNLLGVVGGSLIDFLTLFLLRALLRKQWLAAVIWVAAWTIVRTLRGAPGPFPPLYLAVLYALIYSVLVFIMLRLGFFALVVAVFVLDSVAASFFTTDFSAWYGASSLAVVILIAALALWGFRLSLASRPLFRAP
jgi:serine/threonine protein kinase